MYSLVRCVTVKSGGVTESHRHSNRDEVWVLQDGTADVVLDGDVREAHAGGCSTDTEAEKVCLRAKVAVQMIEIQYTVMSKGNIECFPWKWT